MSDETEVKGIILDQKEKIKLMKMSKGYYQWEISVLGNLVGTAELIRLQFIDDELTKQYGGRG